MGTTSGHLLASLSAILKQLALPRLAVSPPAEVMLHLLRQLRLLCAHILA